jgi:RNA polymerase sigma factor (sigma-70 family)
VCEIDDVINRRLVALVQQGDAEATDELIRINIPLIKHCAKQVMHGWSKPRRQSLAPDMVQEGSIALLLASRHFDLTSGTIFYVYAKRSILRRMIRKLRGMLIVPLPGDVKSDTYHDQRIAAFALEAVGATDVSQIETWVEHCEGLQDDGDFHQIDNLDEREYLTDMLDLLPIVSREIIKMRHGWDDGNPMLFSDIGKEFGVTGSWARVLYHLAKDELKAILED